MRRCLTRNRKDGLRRIFFATEAQRGGAATKICRRAVPLWPISTTEAQSCANYLD